jgi:transcriptional regulator with XRE-family HTH domain
VTKTRSPWLLELRREVKARLREQGATQASLARYLGITEKHLSQLLTGKTDGSPEMLDRLAAAAGLRIVITDAPEPGPVLPGRRKRVRAREDEPVAEIVAATERAG